MQLRTRLLVAYLAALLPLAIAFGWIASTAARAGFDRALGLRLESVAQAVATELTHTTASGRIARLAPDSENTIMRLQEQLVRQRDANQLRRLRLVDPALRTLVDTEDAEVQTDFVTAFILEPDRPEVERAVEERVAVSSVLFRAKDGTPYKRGYAPVVHEGEVVALVVVEGSASYFALLDDYRQALAGFGIFTLLIVVVVTIGVSRRITAPLGALAATAGRMGDGDLRADIPVGGRDEIGALGRALQQMQASLLSREEEQQMMLAGIAHEVRNPLGGMELFVSLLEESLEGDAEASGYASRVRRELNYLSRVVEEFLRYAREHPLEHRRVDGLRLLQPVVEGLAGLAAERQVALEVACDAGVEASGDLDALRGVVHNLVQNALQATPAGGRVDVALRNEAGRTHLTVKDSGAGMAPEVAAEIFRPFYTTREKGTGLGLPLAKKIVDRHGGALTLETTPGEGTVVHIVLPFRPDVPRAEDGAAGAAGTGRFADEDGEMIG